MCGCNVCGCASLARNFPYVTCDSQISRQPIRRYSGQTRIDICLPIEYIHTLCSTGNIYISETQDSNLPKSYHMGNNHFRCPLIEEAVSYRHKFDQTDPQKPPCSRRRTLNYSVDRAA